MTIEQCYEVLGGSYDEVKTRLMSESIVRKFLSKFLEDKSYELLITSIDEKNYTEAFRAAHTIKGICQNLGLDRLYKSDYELTEALRGGEWHEEDAGLLEAVKRDYERTVSAIKELKRDCCF